MLNSFLVKRQRCHKNGFPVCKESLLSASSRRFRLVRTQAPNDSMTAEFQLSLYCSVSDGYPGSSRLYLTDGCHPCDARGVLDKTQLHGSGIKKQMPRLYRNGSIGPDSSSPGAAARA